MIKHIDPGFHLLIVFNDGIGAKFQFLVPNPKTNPHAYAAWRQTLLPP
jgi:hypothetical protein